MKLHKNQRGFTLIELVATTVILGVLAAVAIPKFNDLKGDATQSAVKGIASTLTAAANSNYATRSVTPTAGIVTSGKTCADVAPQLFAGDALPSVEYAVTGPTLVLGNNFCTLTFTEINGTPKTAQFGVIGIL